MNAQALYSKLLSMRDNAAEYLFKRLTVASALLDVEGWVLSPSGGGGSLSMAIDRLEATCFCDLCGALSLAQLLEVLHHFPEQSHWAAHGFNLKKMHAAMLARRRPKPASTSRTVEPARSLHDELAELRAENESLRRQVADLRRDNRHLRKALKRAGHGADYSAAS